MKKIICSIIIASILLAVMPLSASAGGYIGSGIIWMIDSNGVLTITGEGEIPNYEPGSAPWNGFRTEIKELRISDGITATGGYAFSDCRNLLSVTLPESLVSIGDGVFLRCYSLKSISIPNAVVTIGNEAFSDCWQLSTVSISRWNSSLVSIGDSAFSLCTSLTNMTLPSKLEIIGESAFRSCIRLDGIILPDNLCTIGRFAFESCTSLQSIELPYSVTTIPDFAFFDCKSLSEVHLGRYTREIGREAFMWCESLTRLRVPQSTESVGSHAFGFYYADGEYRLIDDFILGTASESVRAAAESEGITVLYDDPDHVCESICLFCRRCLNTYCPYFNCADKCPGHNFPITGTVSDSITWSLSEAGELFVSGSGDIPDFDYTGAPWYISRDAVKSVWIGDGITSVGAYSFADAENLAEIHLTDSLMSIGFKAFFGCTSLLSAGIPYSVSEIGRMAFAECISLQRVKFSEGLISIGAYAFYNCQSLVPFELPTGLTTIGNAAFEGCVSALSISVPDSTITIGHHAFGFTYTEDRHYEQIPDFTVFCGFGSAAMHYAEFHGLTAVRNDGHTCQSQCPVCSRCLNPDCIYPECLSKCDGVCTLPFDNPYTDVSEEDWFYDGVRYASLKGLFNGVSDDKFDPQGNVTRAQLVTILWRLAGSPKPAKLAPFSDLSSDWYVEAVSFAYERGIADGVGGGRFKPDDPVTREQAALFIMRYSEKIDRQDTSVRVSLSFFADADNVSAYAYDAVSWAVACGIISGMQNGEGIDISPQGNMTRAQASTVFTRILRMK